ncbi:MAG: hypothetical protein PHW18_08225 [Sulfuricurvum sp.]|uniref:hypothetical protein n=1 Tax=Sulfuricurvum sp. TaxID=2025608 RepID=UPI0026374D89|nr:hypothetical protein [Sulfuricurvum sp.]MDD2829543.1 hypothetical protein [Sulfuricurvum sp.]MDD4950475.1 hypothetical protein [Sulfuricurvum sp.]
MTLNEIVPTYGYWGGPGWSAGERTPPGKEPDWNYGVYDGLDALFLKHDKAYWEAEKKAVADPVVAAQMIFDADIALLSDIANGNWDSGLYGVLYAPLAELAFGAKSLWDLAHVALAQLDTLGGKDWKNDPFPDNHTTRPIDPSVSDFYTSAKNWSPPRADPLVLDLDGDGIETIGVSDARNVLFDHDGDGIKTATGWVSADDGMLVLDRNGNGTIDNGGELFGDRTIVDGKRAQNGFAALPRHSRKGGNLAHKKIDAVNNQNFKDTRRVA